MHFTQKMMYMAFGCLLTLAGYILASMNNDSVAQSGAEDVTFGTITCRGLRVVDDEGTLSVILINTEDGGYVAAYGKDDGRAFLHNDEHGGIVAAKGKDGGGAQLSINEHGGAMAVWNKGGKNVLQADVGDMGEGIITTKDKLGYRTGSLP